MSKMTGPTTETGRILKIIGLGFLTGIHNKRGGETYRADLLSTTPAAFNRQCVSDALKQCTSVVVYEAPTIRLATPVASVSYPRTVRPVNTDTHAFGCAAAVRDRASNAAHHASPLFQLAVSARRVCFRAGVQLRYEAVAVGSNLSWS